jgi:hypothetical protein
MTQYIHEPNRDLVAKVKEITAGPQEATPREDLANFQHVLSRKMRGVRFSRGVDNHTSCWVYYPHEKYARGIISVQHRDGERTYCVMSRVIKNNRYGPHSREHYMQWSKNLQTAVKKAAAALPEFSVTEIAAMNSSVYCSNRNEQLQKEEGKRREAVDKLGVSNVECPAFRCLAAMVKQITDGETKQLVQDTLLYNQNVGELRGSGESPMFVYVGQDRSERQTVTGIPLKQVNFRSVRLEDDVRPVRFTEGSEEYNELVGKLSVLSVAQLGDYVHGVGMRVDEDEFYVS